MLSLPARGGRPASDPPPRRTLRASLAVAVAAGTFGLAAPPAGAADVADGFAGDLPTLTTIPQNVTDPDAGSLSFVVSRHGDLSAPTRVDYATRSAVSLDAGFFTPETGEITFAAGATSATVVVPLAGTGAPGGNDHAVQLELSSPDRDAVVADRIATAIVTNDLANEGTLDAAAACQGTAGQEFAFDDAVRAIACAEPVEDDAHDVSYDVLGADATGEGILVRFTRGSGDAANASSTRAQLLATSSTALDDAEPTDVAFAAGQTQKILRINANTQQLFAAGRGRLQFTTRDTAAEIGTFVRPGFYDLVLPQSQSMSGGVEGVFRAGASVAVEAVEDLDTTNVLLVWQRCDADDTVGSTCVSIDRVGRSFASASVRTPTAEDAGHRLRAVAIDPTSPYGDRTQTTGLTSPVVRPALRAPTVSTPEVTAAGTATFAIAGEEDGLSYRYREQGAEGWASSDTSTVRVEHLGSGAHVFEVRVVAQDGSVSPIATVSFVIPGEAAPGGAGDDGLGDVSTPEAAGPTTPAVQTSVAPTISARTIDSVATPTAMTASATAVAPAPRATARMRKRDVRSAARALGNRTRVVVTVVGRHRFAGRAVVPKRLARRLGLPSRTVATFRGAGSGRVTPRLVFTHAAAKALARLRSDTALTLTVDVDDGSTITGTIVLRRG